jgi:hypothetical protein
VSQAVKFHGKPLYQICRSSQKGERTVGILRGEFAKSHEPSDLAEEQGGYGGHFSASRSSGERGTVDSRQRGPLDLLAKFHFGVSWVERPKLRHLDSQNCEVRNPDKVESFVVGPSTWTRARVQAFRHFGVS